MFTIFYMSIRIITPKQNNRQYTEKFRSDMKTGTEL